MTYTPPNKAPEGHKWQTESGDPAHWTGGYTKAGSTIFQARCELISVGDTGIISVWGDGSCGNYIIDAPKRPMEIPWDAIEDCWVCAAVDRSGLVCLYTSRPSKRDEHWYFRNYIGIPESVKFERGDLPWDQSLVWRPGHEPEGEK